MKIKRKVQKNLPQLIEWAWENEIKNKRFIHSDSNPPEYVWVNENSEIEFDEDMILRKNNTFTVEVEEEITEDTVIELLLEVRNGGTVIPYYNESITSQVGKIVKEYHTYIDGEFKLIWTHEKGLVE